MRLFIAVNLSQEVKQSIRAAIDQFPISNPPWRWVRDEALHITLKFLGDTPEDRIPHLITQIHNACRTHKIFNIRLEPMGGFPNLKKPRVLFYKVVEGNDALTTITGDINTCLFDGLGIPVERKPFRAHVTIARIKQSLPQEITSRFTEAPLLTEAAQSVRSIDLMSSELRGEGARYKLVKGIALDASA